jgi:hypothetical protein
MRTHNNFGRFHAAVVATALIMLTGCAKNQCYECSRGQPLPDTQTFCAKGQDLDVKLAWYRSSGYGCSKVSGASTITGPSDAVGPVMSAAIKELRDGNTTTEACGCDSVLHVLRPRWSGPEHLSRHDRIRERGDK